MIDLICSFILLYDYNFSITFLFMKRFLYYFFCTVNYLPIYSFVYYLILLLTPLFICILSYIITNSFIHLHIILYYYSLIYLFVYYLILLLTYLFVYFYFFLGGLKQEMSEQFLQLHSKYDSSPRLSVKGVVNNCCLLCYKVVHNAEGTNVHSAF